MSSPTGTWQNWARNQQAVPRAVIHPESEDDLVDAVRSAADRGEPIRAVGAGHSFTDAAVTDGTMVVLDRYQDVVDVDPASGLVTVHAGITLSALSQALDGRGLALANMGDIAYQTIAGAISTGTHGTGVALPGIAGQVTGMRLVTGTGEVLTCEGDDLDHARVSLGAAGLVSTVTVQAVPAFNLHAVEVPMRLDRVLDEIDGHVEGADHFEFFWVPHTGWALTKTNRRTDEPLRPRRRYRYWRDKVLMENVAFGVVCRLGRFRPAWIPRLATALPGAGRVEYVEPSYRVFASPRTVRFVEMEYAIPREACAEAVREVRRLVEDRGLLLNFPVEVRFTAADTASLATSHGRATCYVAVHVFEGMPHEPYFSAVEAVMRAHDGRPHWGKLHGRTAADLAPAYPRWGEFQAFRARHDPHGVFRNAYTDRVLGSAATPHT